MINGENCPEMEEMDSRETMKNLDRFCYRGDALDHQYLEKPFRLEGWMYASNGVICVRVPSKGKDAEDVPPKRRYQAIAAFRDFSAKTCVELWPGRTSELRDTKCPICHELQGIVMPLVREKK